MTHANNAPWFTKAGAASSIMPLSHFVGSRIFALKGGGYARTNSLEIFESSSARQTRHVFSCRLASLSGRTVTPLRAISKAPAFTTKAMAEPSATKGNASPGAVTC